MKSYYGGPIGTHQPNAALLRTVPSPTPTASLSPRLGVCNPNPKLQSVLSQLRTANLAGFTGSIRSSEQKPIKNFGEKGAWAYPVTVPIFWVLLLSQEWVKLYEHQILYSHSWFIGSIATKTHRLGLKISAKFSRGRILRDSVIFAVVQLPCFSLKIAWGHLWMTPYYNGNNYV